MLIACLIAFSFLSCYDLEDNPGPTISFTAKPNGEGNVTFDVLTANAETFHWDFGDGNFSDEKLPTHTYKNNGIYNVILSAKGKEGESVTTGQVTVNDITGSVVFWMMALKTKDIEVSVDGQYYGKITGSYATDVPICGAQYAVTVTKLSEGPHTFHAVESNTISDFKWTGGISVSAGKCKSVTLTY